MSHCILCFHVSISDKKLRLSSHIADSTTAMNNAPKILSIEIVKGIFTSMGLRPQLEQGVLDMPTCGVLVRDHWGEAVAAWEMPNGRGPTDLHMPAYIGSAEVVLLAVIVA